MRHLADSPWWLRWTWLAMVYVAEHWRYLLLGAVAAGLGIAAALWHPAP